LIGDHVPKRRLIWRGLYVDRCRTALDWLEAKRLPTGGFPAEKKFYRATGKAKSGRSRFDWGGADKRRPNPFVSVDALAVLKAAGRLGVK